MPTALLDSVPDASGAGTPGNTIDFLFYVAALLGGAATNIAVGMNTTLGKAFAEHRMLAALTMQGVGLPALFLVALVGGAFWARPSPTPCPVAPVGLGRRCGADRHRFLRAGGVRRGAVQRVTVTGGTIIAVLLDHLGPLGFGQRDATLSRIGGCALLIAGTVLVASG